MNGYTGVRAKGRKERSLISWSTEDGFPGSLSPAKLGPVPAASDCDRRPLASGPAWGFHSQTRTVFCFGGSGAGILNACFSLKQPVPSICVT